MPAPLIRPTVGPGRAWPSHWSMAWVLMRIAILLSIGKVIRFPAAENAIVCYG
jgi:hypothetical protein